MLEHRKERQHRNAECHAGLGDGQQLVERAALNPGHRAHVLRLALAIEHEHRIDEIARVQARLAHQLAAPGVATQAPRPAVRVGRRGLHVGDSMAPDNRLMGSSLLWVKAFHIVFVSSWFAGLFYLPRIFVTLAGVPADSHAERERLLMMARKLYRFSSLLMIAAIGLGLVLWLVYGVGRGPHNYWLHAKIAFVVAD